MKITIEADTNEAGGKVIVDGKELYFCTGATITLYPLEIPEVHLFINATENLVRDVMPCYIDDKD